MTWGDERGLARAPRGAGRIVAGVGAGLAARWEVSPLVVRAGFVVATFAYGAGALLYLALTAALPVRGASPQRIARSAETGRTLLAALQVIGAGVSLVLLLVLSALLALFGFAAVSTVLACACVAALVWVPEARPTALGAVAVALTLPASAVLLGGVQLAPQLGARVVELRGPGEVDPDGYRAGTGPLAIDLRRFSAPNGSVTTIRARADLRSLVVALPRRRCFTLIISQTLDRGWPARLLDRWQPLALSLGSPVRQPTSRERRLARGGVPAGLIVYGRPVMGRSVRWRTSAPADAPVLQLALATGRGQAIVRDYPIGVDPLRDPWWPRPSEPDDPRFGIARGITAADSVPNDPLVPAVLAAVDSAQRDRVVWDGGTERATVSVIEGLPAVLTAQRRRTLERFARQAVLLRRAAEQDDAFASRFDGRCAGAPADRLQLRREMRSPQDWIELREAVARRRWPQQMRAVASSGRRGPEPGA